MEGRRRRVLLLVVLFAAHALGLWALAEFGRLRERPTTAAIPGTRVMLLDLAPPPRAVDPALQLPPPRREARRPAASPRRPARAPQPAVPTWSRPLPPPASFFDARGRLRIPRNLAAELDADAAAAAAVARTGPTFHVPRGDEWILRAPRSPLPYEPTLFEQAWMPAHMNPVEEACWRSRPLQILLTMLQSIDCMAPGKHVPRPAPEMIVYGEDDGAGVLRKSDEWARHNHR